MTTDAVEEVESIGDSEPLRPAERYRRQRAEDVVAAIYEDAERIKRREVEAAVRKLEARGDLSGVQRDAVEGMADAIVDQLLAAPTERLGEPAEWSTLHGALHLFEPAFETSDEDTPGGHRDRQKVNDDD